MTFKTYNIHVISGILAAAGFLIGLESSSLHTFIHSAHFTEYYGPLSSWERGLVGSSLSLGAIIGALAFGILGDKTQFVVVLQTAILLSGLGTVLALSLPSMEVLCGARIIKGMTFGLLATLVPTYIADTIPKSHQGYSLSVFHISSTVGAIAMYYGGYGLQVHIDSMMAIKAAWAAELVPATLLFCLNFVLPDSPKHLGILKRWDEASKTIDRIHRKNKGSAVDNEEYVILLYTAGSSIESMPFLSLFSKRYHKHTAVGVLVQCLLQCSMVGVLGTYIVHLCEASSLETLLRNLLGGSPYVVLGVFTFVPLLLLDHTRRKDAMVFGYFLLTLAYSSIFVINYRTLSLVELSQMFNWNLEGVFASAALALFAFIISVYSGCLVSVSWLYTSEIFPTTMRAKGYSMSMIVSSLASAFINVVFPPLVTLSLYWLFLGLSITCAFSMLLLTRLPETKHLSSGDVELLFLSANVTTDTFPLQEKNDIESPLESSSPEKAHSVPTSISYELPHEPNRSMPITAPIVPATTGGSREDSSFLSTDWIQARHVSTTSPLQPTLSTLVPDEIENFDYTESEPNTSASILAGPVPALQRAHGYVRPNPFAAVR